MRLIKKRKGKAVSDRRSAVENSCWITIQMYFAQCFFIVRACVRACVKWWRERWCMLMVWIIYIYNWMVWTTRPNGIRTTAYPHILSQQNETNSTHIKKHALTHCQYTRIIMRKKRMLEHRNLFLKTKNKHEWEAGRKKPSLLHSPWEFETQKISVCACVCT